MSTPQTRFLRRFDRIWAQARRVQLVQALCWGVLTALAGLGLLAAADYAFELSHTMRLIGLSTVAIAAAAIAIGLVVGSLRRWRRSATAATIEEVFPQLGQRIRTTVQFGEMSSDEIQHEGVATTLVTALEDDTVKLAQPLPLDAVIPWKSLAFASLLAAVLGMALTGAAALDWQWQTAATRTFLGEQPYTNITVEPGNMDVREGESQTVHITVEGRIGDHITFKSRRLDEEKSEWRVDTYPLADAESQTDRKVEFLVPLDRMKHPLEYQVAAGSTETQLYRVNVLYPLKVVQIQTTIHPPEYTKIGEVIIEGGTIAALEGSSARIQVELDRVPESGWLELQNMATRRNENVLPPEEIPLQIDGKKMTGELTITRDQTFSIMATAADGMELPENKQRIRARKDEPPHVWFESPSEALEVLTLAEILMRIRVSDDFGLARAGVVFEVNNEEEYRLMDEDFQSVPAAAAEVEKTGQLSAKTRATLEKVLPLEHFELTQQDSIMYYAVAEDNRPGKSQITETDLRFIDIRPFRRTYRALPSADGMPGGNQGPQLKTLEELIARQRHALNRTIQTNRKFERTQQADLSGIDSVIKFEGELAKSTRELAEGLQARGIDETELLFQAETAMLAATDSLSAGSYETSSGQMRDALKNLIEGRNRLQVLISKNRDRQQLAQLRAFDRTQQQKLRRPKSDEEEARQIAERLKELADKEEFLYQTIASMTGGGLVDPMSQGPGESGKKQEPREGQKSEDPEKTAKNPDKTGPDKAGSNPDKTGPDPDKTGKDPDKTGEDSETANDDPKTGDSGDQPKTRKVPTPQELEDQQLDVASEARELEKALGKLPKATDLAKERIAGAAKAAEEAAGKLGSGDNEAAQKDVHEAGGLFRELAEQIAALLADEKAKQIAAAQQMAADLARRQDDFADKLANSGEGGGPGKPKKEDEDQPGLSEEEKKARAEKREEERKMGLGEAAQEIADKAKTLADVLGAAGKGETPEDQAAADKIKELAGSLDIAGVVERLQKLPGQVGAGQMEDAKANAGDGAERMESAAEQIASLHRVIVAPQVDELAKAEEKLNALSQELDQLETETQVGGWHTDANDLLDDLDKLGVDEKLRQEFQEEMNKGLGGFNRKDSSWVRTDGYFRAPASYRPYLTRLQASLQGRLQELMLGDLLNSGDEPIPPQYQELVDKYYQVLSRRAADGAPATKKVDKKQGEKKSK